jgi:hypothetical protein
MTMHDNALIRPEIKVANPHLFVNRANKTRNFCATTLWRFNVKSTADV